MATTKKTAAPKKKPTAKKVVSKVKKAAAPKKKTTDKKGTVKNVVFKDGEASKAGFLQRSLEKKGFSLISLSTSTEWEKHGEKVVIRCTSKSH